MKTTPQTPLTLTPILLVAIALLFAGCDGCERGCSAEMAQNYGADWIIVQYDYTDAPFRCWRLEDVSVANENGSDGIYWLADGGNLVHLSGMYTRIQVEGDNWAHGFREIGLTPEGCEALHNAVFDVESGEYR